VAAVLRIARLGHRFFLRWIGGSERTAATTLALTQLLSSQQYRIRRWQKAARLPRKRIRHDGAEPDGKKAMGGFRHER
jgi:hypothetical protein